jgi:hypothetical protein
MAKLVADAVLDAALQYLEDNVDFLSVCEGAPTTYEHAHSNKGTATGKALASSATPTFTGPVDDAASPYGRKTTVDEEAAMSVAVSGDADHVALCKTGTTVLLYVTTCTLQTLTAGNTVTAPAWKIQIGDPA